MVMKRRISLQEKSLRQRTRKSCFQEGDTKEDHGGDQRRSRKLWELLDTLSHQRYGGDKSQLNNDAKKAQTQMKLKNQRCSKLKMGEPWLEIKVKAQRIKESKANEAEVMVWRVRGPKLVKR